MRRHVVAIIGSAGALPRDLRHTAEALARPGSASNSVWANDRAGSYAKAR